MGLRSGLTTNQCKEHAKNLSNFKKLYKIRAEISKKDKNIINSYLSPYFNEYSHDQNSIVAPVLVAFHNNWCIIGAKYNTTEKTMATILQVIPNEEVRDLVTETIKEHQEYFARIYPGREYLEVTPIVKTTTDFIDSNDYDADVIIARGLLASRMKKFFPSIPVVETPVTITDLMEALQRFLEQGPMPKKIALIGLGMILHQIEMVEKQFHTELIPIDYLLSPNSSDPIGELFHEAVTRGFLHFMGGLTLVKRAEQEGYSGSFVNSCKDSIWLALTEAQHIAAIRRQERERAARFQTILNGAVEGIVTTNSSRKIIQMNVAAGEILRVDPADIVGKHIESLIPEPRFLALLRKNTTLSNEILKVGDKRLVLSKVAVSLGKEAIGNVYTFQNVQNVQQTEIKIRSELHRKGHVAKYRFEDIIGESEAIALAKNRARIYASVPSNVLILGETGTGKELFAQSIHNASVRKNAPFIAVNCAAIPENLIESEFFGYAGGAFTGASKEGKMGFFELAHGGTLFLDEVSEIPLNLQSKLLRVIQEGEVMRIGHDMVIPVNVRVISASNKDLKPLTRQSLFREDLYYRLAVVQLPLPPLRNREQDTALIADHFITHFSNLYSTQQKQLTTHAKEQLINLDWEGNIRELRNVCEQLVVLSQSSSIDLDEVHAILDPSDSSYWNTRREQEPVHEQVRAIEKNIAQMEKEMIKRTLEENQCNRSKTARILGMDRSTLWRKMKEYGIECRSSIERG